MAVCSINLPSHAECSVTKFWSAVIILVRRTGENGPPAPILPGKKGPTLINLVRKVFAAGTVCWLAAVASKQRQLTENQRRCFSAIGCACDVTNLPRVSVTNQIDLAAILSGTECQLPRTAP